MTVPDAATELLVAASLIVLVGLCAAVAGLSVRQSGDVTLVSGYRHLEITDEAGLARLVGTVVAGVGLLTVVVGVATPLLPTATRTALWAGYVIALVVATLFVWVRRREYVASGDQ